MENCKVCNSIVCEITLFNGETKYFCSPECLKTNKLIETFRDYIQSKINQYQHIHPDELVNFFSKADKKLIKSLISEVLRRGYFYKDKVGSLCQKGKTIKL